MTKNVANIRPATLLDYDAWLPLWQAYLEFYKATIAHETTLTTWARLLDEREPMHAVLAEIGGTAVGMVHFIEHRSCWNERKLRKRTANKDCQEQTGIF